MSPAKFICQKEFILESISTTEIKELPNGRTDDKDFKKKVEESRESIRAAHSEKLGRRGPGRPKKIRPEESKRETINTQALSQDPVVRQPSPDVSIYLKNPIMFVSKIPAAKHGVPELAFSEDEAMACAQSINGVLQAFVPDQNAMDPKTASILSLGMVVGSIGFQKYMIYMSAVKSKIEEPKKEENTQPTINDFGSVDSQNYFQTIKV